MHEQFISERIEPVKGTISTRGAVLGEPGFPGMFHWRDRDIVVADIIEKWKETSRCRSGSNEQYVRKHWFRIRTTDHSEMKIYFERQARSRSQRLQRWWLYTLLKNEEE